MAEVVKIKVVFDDKDAKAGIDRINKTEGKGGGGTGGGKGKGGSGGGASLAGFGAILAQQIGAQIQPALQAALAPLQTTRQREEAGVSAAAPLIGAAVGAAVGSAIPGLGTVIGGAIGAQLGSLAAEVAKLIDPEGRAVNDAVSNTLQTEAATRARLGIPLDKEELRSIGQAEQAGARAEFRARQKAVSLTDEIEPGLTTQILSTLGLIRGKSSDQGPAVHRDAVAQMTEDSW